MSRVKYWFWKINNWIGNFDKNSAVEEKVVFNPLGWGILFFTMWLSLKVVNNIKPLTSYQNGLALAALAVSILLFISILLLILLRKPLSFLVQNQSILPVLFVATIFVYVIGWLTVIPALKGTDIILGLIIGFLWLVAYGMVGISRYKPHWIRAGFCLMAFILWLCYIPKGIIGSWPLLVFFLALVLATLKPSRLRSIPLV